MEHLDLEVATEFLLIAATLVELKTRRLLPGSDDVDLDDELGLWEERDLLLARLVECKTFKDAAGRPRGPGRRGRPLVPPRRGPRGALRRAHARPAGRRHPARPPPGVPPGRHPQAGRRGSTSTTSPRSGRRSPTPWRSCSTSCPASGTITFRQLTGDLVERLEVVVRFLAVLELFKQGFVDLDQPRSFGDIRIVWLGRDRVRARRARRRSTPTRADP